MSRAATPHPPAGPPTFLTAERRLADIERLADGETVDVLVIGGGVTGAGAALDAAARGLSVALVERRDLANGTSRWSSKLVHGGLRYLANGQFGVAWESAVERDLLAGVTAPHLIRALPQVTPMLGRRPRPVALALEAGNRVGDGMRRLAGTPGRRLPAMRWIRPPEARMWFPELTDTELRRALLSWDCQLEDDARLVIALARTAAAHGARIVTRCEVESIGRPRVAVTDTLTGERFEICARHVVNATGVWAGSLVDGVELRPSRGSHLLLDAERLRNPSAALLVPIPEHFGRFVFLLPRADGLVLLGLTDEQQDDPTIPDEPAVPAADEEFLLQTASLVLERPLSTADVVGRFAGLRPLLRAGASDSADISRRHAVIDDPHTGVVTVVGGKLTTYRRMAQDAIDVIAARPGVEAGSCRTARLPLVGAAGGPLATGLPQRLVRRFGSEAAEIAALAAGRSELLEPLSDDVDVLPVEFVAGVEREGALTVGDLLDRRTRLGLVPRWRALGEPFAADALATLSRA